MIKKFLFKIKRTIYKFKNLLFVHKFFHIHKEGRMIWVYPHIGDMVYGLLPLPALEETTGHQYIIIGNKKYEALYKGFAGVEQVILLSEHDLWRFAYCNLGYLGKKYIYKRISKGYFITNDFEFYKKQYPPLVGETLVAYTQRVIYKVRILQFKLPRFNRSTVLKNTIITQNAIIISPYAQSVQPIPTQIFEDMAAILSKNDYIVFTNCGPTEKPINGTSRLACSLEELYEFAPRAKAFIGLRSGICDLLALTKLKMYIFYNNYPLGEFASLREYSQNIVEFYNNDFKKYTEIILKDLVYNEN